MTIVNGDCDTTEIEHLSNIAGDGGPFLLAIRQRSRLSCNNPSGLHDKS